MKIEARLVSLQINHFVISLSKSVMVSIVLNLDDGLREIFVRYRGYVDLRDYLQSLI